jgi:hypothetical protein
MGKRAEQQAVEQAYRVIFDQAWPEVKERIALWSEFTETDVESCRDDVEAAFRRRVDVGKLDPRKQSDAYLLAEEFRKDALRIVGGRAFRAMANRSIEDIRKSSRRRLPKAVGQPYKWDGVRARNLELIAFVAERIIPFRKWCDGELKVGHGGRGPKITIPWDALAEEWSHTHRRGYDSGKSMARAYYRAVNSVERPIYREYMKQVQSEIREALDRYERELGRAIRGLLDVPALPLTGGGSESDPTPDLLAEVDRASYLRRSLRNMIAHCFPEEHLPLDAAHARVVQVMPLRVDAAGRDLPRNELIFSRVWALALPSPDGKERSYGREMPLRHWFLLDQERQKGSSGQAG